jgi:hypothetical protein
MPEEEEGGWQRGNFLDPNLQRARIELEKFPGQGRLNGFIW